MTGICKTGEAYCAHGDVHPHHIDFHVHVMCAYTRMQACTVYSRSGVRQALPRFHQYEIPQMWPDHLGNVNPMQEAAEIVPLHHHDITANQHKTLHVNAPSHRAADPTGYQSRRLPLQEPFPS